MFLYMLQSFALSFGMILYPFLRQTIGVKVRLVRVLLVISGLGYGLGLLSTGNIGSYGHAVTLMILLPVTMGFCQGAAYVRLARDMYDSELIGRILGISLGLSIVFQYFLQIRYDTGLFLYILMFCLNTGIIIWETVAGEQVSVTEPTAPAGNKKDLTFLRLILIASCLDILAVYLDGQMERLLNTSDFFARPRLLYAAGFVAMGFLWDMKKAEKATVIMMIFAVMAVLMPALLMEERFYLFDICFFYFYLGLCVVYNTSRFIKYAADSGNMYAAPAYRVMDNLLTGLLVLAGFSKLPQLSALIIDTLLLALIVFLVWREGTMTRRVRTEKTLCDRKDAFAIRYRLTDREKEVFELLITKDEKGDDMAKELGVSRRGFVSLTSSIYKKTDTGSRVALLQKYMSE
ncbi:MAG: hypothetical protein K6F34_01435 [Lachnospiraceae bacterium]|nr:hypothetical protein [Lachnospiraceae bacterium]